MSRRDSSRPSPDREPTRIPGQGGIELESTAGSIQLQPFELPHSGNEPKPGGRKRERSRGLGGRTFGPGEKVPVSGVYNVLDENGAYLERQITCHSGNQFPPQGKKGVHPQYELAYRAIHLAPTDEPLPYPPNIYRPGETVPISGLYDVVDEEGRYVYYQRALVEDHDVFDPLEDPVAYGYVLAFPARHLHHGLEPG